MARLREVVTVEPVLFTLKFSFSILFPLRLQYIKQSVGVMHGISGVDSGHSGDTNNSCETVNRSDPNYILFEQLQAEASTWILYFEVLSAVLTLISASFLGSYSERGGGRKICVLIPVTGLTLYLFCILINIYLELPLSFLFIAEFIRGITGQGFTATAMSYAYIADITTEEQRAFRLILLEVCGFIGGSLAQITTGYWIRSHGYLPPTWLAYSLMILTVLYIIFWVEETVPVDKSVISKWKMRQQFVDIVSLFTGSSQGTRFQLSVFSICLFVFFLIIGSAPGIIILSLLGPPLCFTSVYIGYYQAIYDAMNAIGLFVAGKVLTRYLGDLATAQVGFLSYGSSFLVIAFAVNDIMVLFAPVIGFILTVPLPAIKARISKLFEPGKQGIVFAYLGCIQSVSHCLSPVIFNGIYSATVTKSSSLIFITYAATLTIPAFLVAMVQIMQCRKTRQEKYQTMEDVCG
ncbi:proton-coupled folate transporter-like isoform X2 [Ptychodera flava]|uniref:proton-coupled folate transporter-like isoform X2 n=1 Tax=Ptychodera flava TaxID=63121 RepID=UPI00396A0E1E